MENIPGEVIYIFVAVPRALCVDMRKGFLYICMSSRNEIEHFAIYVGGLGGHSEVGFKRRSSNSRKQSKDGVIFTPSELDPVFYILHSIQKLKSNSKRVRGGESMVMRTRHILSRSMFSFFKVEGKILSFGSQRRYPALSPSPCLCYGSTVPGREEILEIELRAATNRCKELRYTLKVKKKVAYILFHLYHQSKPATPLISYSDTHSHGWAQWVRLIFPSIGQEDPQQHPSIDTHTLQHLPLP